MAAASRLLPSRRTLTMAAGVISGVAALAAGSSSVSALRQKQT